MTKPKISPRYFELTFQDGKREYICVTSEKKTDQLSFDIWNMCCEKGEKVYAVTPTTEMEYVKYNLSLKITERLTANPNQDESRRTTHRKILSSGHSISKRQY